MEYRNFRTDEHEVMSEFILQLKYYINRNGKKMLPFGKDTPISLSRREKLRQG